jgi:HEAT repeat protein
MDVEALRVPKKLQPGELSRMAGILFRLHALAVQQVLQRLLTDDNKGVRLPALEGLSQTGSGIDIAQLRGPLKNPDLKIKNKAIKALVKLNHPPTAYYLIEPPQDESDSVRRDEGAQRDRRRKRF